MRVLLVGRPDDGIVGGDFIQIEKTKEALESNGIECEFVKTLDLSGINTNEYDIVHVFVLLVRGIAGKLRGKNIVLSPLYRDPKYDE